MQRLLCFYASSTEKWFCGYVHLRYEVGENSYYHQSEQLICHRAHYSSLGAEGVVGAAELHIKWLSDKCALGVFIAVTG